ncbi:MAG TPA: PilZ domain-containing protein [Myxococcota bacterium]|nr:PilZ domain-containing protein [Myxococcota bacterium]
MSGAERREFSRFPVQPLLCKTLPRRNGVCVLKDVSMGGAFFQHSSPPPIGTRLTVEFSEPPLLGYDLQVLVVRHNPGRFKGFAVNVSPPRPRLLRAVYCNEYPY